VVAGKSSYQGRGKGGDIVVDIEVVVLEGVAYRGGVDIPMNINACIISGGIIILNTLLLS